MLLIFAFEDVRDPEIFIWTLHVCPGTVQIVDNKLWNDRQIQGSTYWFASANPYL